LRLKRKGIAGRTIAIVVILLIVVAGGVGYVYLTQSTSTNTTNTNTTNTTPAGKYNVTYFYQGDLSHPDPAVGSDLSGSNIYLNVYDALVSFDQSTPPKLVPGLATSWSQTSDGLHYTFKLRSGVTFHDGTKVAAADVAYSMDRMMTLNQGFSFLWSGILKPGETQVVNSSAVTFNLEKTFGPFVSTLAYFFILNSATVKANTASSGAYGANGDYGTAWFAAGGDAGSGPYKLTEWKQNIDYKFTQNPTYWGGWKNGQIYQETVLSEAEEATIKALFPTTPGAFSTEFLSTAFYQWASTASGVSITFSTASPDPHYIFLDTASAPLNNVHFRRALTYLFNYTDFETNIRASGLFHDKPLSWGMLPSVFPYYDSALAPPTTANFASARSELAASGLNVASLRALTCSAIQGIEFEHLACLQISNNAKQLGITINVQDLLWSKYNQDFGNSGTTDDMVAVTEAGLYLDPDSILYNTFHSVSTTHTWAISPTYFTNSTLDTALSTGRTSTDTAARQQAYTTAQQILAQNVPAIPIMEQGLLVAHDSHVTNMIYNFEYLWQRAYFWVWSTSGTAAPAPAGLHLQIVHGGVLPAQVQTTVRFIGNSRNIGPRIYGAL
jgi:peptide/nickel transport system substrate-binding protein